MKIIRTNIIIGIISISIFLISIRCNQSHFLNSLKIRNKTFRNESAKFTFDSFTFILPCSVRDLKQFGIFHFDENLGYIGYTKNYHTEARILHRPIWTGDEHIPESHYIKEEVIGITFEIREDSVNIDSLKKSLSVKFKSNFQTYNNKKFEYINISNDFIVTISKRSYQIKITSSGDIYANYYNISFYKNLNLIQITEYVD